MKQTAVWNCLTHVNGWAVYMSYKSQNCRLLHVSILSVKNLVLLCSCDRVHCRPRLQGGATSVAELPLSAPKLTRARRTSREQSWRRGDDRSAAAGGVTGRLGGGGGTVTCGRQ